MSAKTFMATFRPGTRDVDSFDLKINNWMEDHPDAQIYNMAMGISEKEGFVTALLVIAFDEDEDEATELEISLPLARRLR